MDRGLDTLMIGALVCLGAGVLCFQDARAYSYSLINRGHYSYVGYQDGRFLTAQLDAKVGCSSSVIDSS